MNLQFTYQEIAEYVHRKFGREVALLSPDGNTLQIGTTIKMKLPLVNREVAKDLSIKVSDIQVSGDDATFRYDAGAGMNFIATNFFKLLSGSLIQQGMIEFQYDSCAIVHLAAIDQMKNVLRFVNIKQIVVQGDKLVIACSLK